MVPQQPIQAATKQPYVPTKNQSMNNTNSTDPVLTLKVLHEMAANYRGRVPEVYWPPFNATLNHRISRAKALRHLLEGGHQ